MHIINILVLNLFAIASMSGGGAEEANLESTPTWVVSIVCTLIVLISLAAERLIHLIGKYLKRTNKKPLYQALQKIKEELMLVGFISLLLTVFQGKIGRLCISEELASKWLPCQKQDRVASHHTNSTIHTTWHRLLSTGTDSNFCHKKGKVPVLSITALHHLHIFIFVLAAVHVTTCALTILFGGLKIRQWRSWEESINGNIGNLRDLQTVTCLQTHCKTNPNFNFHKYMVRAFESDFKKVVGISWFLWLFVVVFLFLNVNGYHAYFWIAFIPLILLLGVGTKLEHVIIQLARQMAQKHTAIIGNNIEIQPSDDHFWFHKPRILLLLIHIILFQNSFELAFFFWIWVQYGFDSCIMGSIGYTIPRLVIAVFVQFLCSYSTLPLYAIITQMGSCFNKAIFDDHIQEGLIDWAHKAKKTTSTAPAVRVLAKRIRSMPILRSKDNGSGQGSLTPPEVPNHGSGLPLENQMANIEHRHHSSITREIEHEPV
ncbi:MLO-like protein 1 [Silene latifolia]|uniref:MLO-like protein 1 n=1 Tax=Silene latifolia TaxID=37657 RepID=UPI003D78276D